MIQTLPKRSRQGRHIISQVRANYDRQCADCDDPIDRGEDCLLIHDTDSRGMPIPGSDRLTHTRHAAEYTVTASAPERRPVGEF